jgi:hypothetical protein
VCAPPGRVAPAVPGAAAEDVQKQLPPRLALASRVTSVQPRLLRPRRRDKCPGEGRDKQRRCEQAEDEEGVRAASDGRSEDGTTSAEVQRRCGRVQRHPAERERQQRDAHTRLPRVGCGERLAGNDEAKEPREHERREDGLREDEGEGRGPRQRALE